MIVSDKLLNMPVWAPPSQEDIERKKKELWDSVPPAKDHSNPRENVISTAKDIAEEMAKWSMENSRQGTILALLDGQNQSSSALVKIGNRLEWHYINQLLVKE